MGKQIKHFQVINHEEFHFLTILWYTCYFISMIKDESKIACVSEFGADVFVYFVCK